jgi:hypothetical protein
MITNKKINNNKFPITEEVRVLKLLDPISSKIIVIINKAYTYTFKNKTLKIFWAIDPSISF